MKKTSIEKMPTASNIAISPEPSKIAASNDVSKEVAETACSSPTMSPAAGKRKLNFVILLTPISDKTMATSVSSTPKTPENENQFVKAKVSWFEQTKSTARKI